MVWDGNDRRGEGNPRDWDGIERRGHYTPHSLENLIDLENMLERSAAHGSKRALKELGLDDPETQSAFRDLITLIPILRQVAESWKALGWMGKAVKWLSGIVIAGGSIWAVIHHFFVPPKH